MNEKWPRISIVTPSLNQGEFIEETINSVLSQEYPNLEYIVIDGGSTDQTISVLEKFADRVIWVSERDEGQTEAINKGLTMATGEILSYLNADDTLLPNSLFSVADLFLANPHSMWITGRCRIIDEGGKDIRSIIYNYKKLLLYSTSYSTLLVTNYISQPATFWRKELQSLCGLFDQGLHYVMDYDYWLRLWKVRPPNVYHHDLACFRIQKKSKTTASGHLSNYISEENVVITRHSISMIWYYLHIFHRLLMTVTYKIING